MKALLCTMLFLATWSAGASDPIDSTATVGPVEVVTETAGRIMDALRECDEAFRTHPERLKQLVRDDLLPALDIKYSARLILGRAGRGATPEQLEAFTHAMSNVLIERYATGLLEYRNRDQLEVLPVRGEISERMTRVRTRVQLDSGKFIPVDYVFHLTDEGWKAFDVIVEGISYVTTYRNQIMPQVEKSGLDTVIERLNKGDLQLNG